MTRVRRPDPRAPGRPLSAALAPAAGERSGPGAPLRPLLFMAAALLALALLLPHDDGPPVPGDELRPVAVAIASPAPPTGMNARAGDSRPATGDSSASVIPGDPTPRPRATPRARATPRPRRKRKAPTPRLRPALPPHHVSTGAPQTVAPQPAAPAVRTTAPKPAPRKHQSVGGSAAAQEFGP